MEDPTPTNDTPTNGSAAEQPPTAIALTGASTGSSLTNADIAALSRERQHTLLSILPPAVAAILITNRPPMPLRLARLDQQEHHRTARRARAGARVRLQRQDDRGPAQPRGRRDPPVVAAAARRGRHQGPGHADHDAAPLPHGAADRSIVADEDTGERDIEEPKKPAGQRRSAQGQQRRTAAPVGGRGGGATGSRQPQPGADQLKNRTDALLAKLPNDVADQLRQQHKDPNELLRRTTEELNRRNAAASRGADTPADGNGTAKPATEQPGSGTPPANDSGTSAARTPAEARLEKTINEGMRALRLSADEQTELRKQFPNDPQGLLTHIKALYSAGQDKQGDA